MSLWNHFFKHKREEPVDAVALLQSREAHGMATKLVATGKYADAAYYFMNALAKTPGKVDLIKDYVGSELQQAQSHRDAGRTDDADRHYDWVRAFLQERLLHVAPSEIAALRILLDEIEAPSPKNEAAGSMEDEPSTEIAAQKASIADGSFDWTLPATHDAVEQRLGELDGLMDCVTEDDALPDGGPAGDALEDYISHLRWALDYHPASEHAEELLAAAQIETSIPVAAYCMQAVESTVRQLVVSKRHLDAARQERIEDLMTRLEHASTKLAETRASKESQTIWDDVADRLRPALEVAKAWKKPDESSPEQKASRGLCQKQIDRLKEITKIAQKELGRLTAPEEVKKAEELWEQLGKLMKAATDAQQHQYNVWAMNQIKSTYTSADQHTGLTTDAEKLSGVIIRLLAVIDTRFLTSEVQRCYTEVFEYLFAKLKGPKSKDDFETDGRKLMVLKAMAATPKVALSKC